MQEISGRDESGRSWGEVDGSKLQKRMKVNGPRLRGRSKMGETFIMKVDGPNRLKMDGPN